MNYQKNLFFLIAIFAMLHSFSAATQELSNVEAYYWALATHLQWNYFDHPPIVAWLIRTTTLNMALHSELFVRLGAILSSAVCTWLMFKVGCFLYNARTGWLAALLYSTSIYAGMSVAVFILPDSPQMVFWLASIYTLLKIIRLNVNDRAYSYLWLLFGLLAGLTIMCKVHGIFLWAGAITYFIIYNRQAFQNKFIFVAMGITLITVSPIVVWNFQHHFITYHFHSGRVNFRSAQIDLARFLKQFIEIVFSTGPIHFVLICIGIYAAVKGKLPVGNGELRLLLLCSLPLIFVVWIISIFNEVLPHWPGPGFSVLLLLPAARLATNLNAVKKAIPMVIRFTMAYLLLITLADFLSINYFPGTLSTQKQGMKIGADDATLDMYGWKQAGLKFDSLYHSDLADQLMTAHAPIVIGDWITAAHIDYYIASPVGMETWGLGDAYSLHQYFWMNKYKRPLLKGQNAYFIMPTDEFSYKNVNKITGEFNDFNFALIYPEYRGGLICKQYYVLRLYGYKGVLNR